jgi:sulfonate transport system permease protein
MSAARRGILPLLGAVIALLVWESAARMIGNLGLFPSSIQVWGAFRVWMESGLLANDLLESLPRAIVALVLATPLGVMAGMALGLSNPVHAMFNAPVQLLRCLPPVALLPLFILWFGIDWNSKVAAATFVCVFPIAVTTYQAATITDLAYRELATDLNLGWGPYIWKVVLPGSLPAIVPGLRLAAGTSFIMVFVSELAGASAGLGYRISVAQLAYQADLMIAGLIVLGLAGLGTDMLITGLARRVLHYAGR